MGNPRRRSTPDNDRAYLAERAKYAGDNIDREMSDQLGRPVTKAEATLIRQEAAEEGS